MTITFADLSDQQLHQLAGLTGVAHGGLDRPGLIAAMAAANPGFQEDNEVAALGAPLLRNLAQAQGLSHAGTRLTIAKRLVEQADP